MLGQQTVEQIRPQADRGQFRGEQFQARVVTAVGPHALAIALGTLQGARVELGGGEGDMPVVAPDQRVGHGRAGIQLREADAVFVLGIAQLHHGDDGAAATAKNLPRALGALEAGEQQTGRLVRQVGAQQTFVLFGTVVADADHHLETGGHQHPLDRLDGVDEYRVGQRRDQHRHQVGFGAGQRPRRRIGHVAQRLGRLHDLRAQRIGNPFRLRQGARGGHQRATGGLGHIG
ncbi:hypothetical protein D9M68_790390 [compost metagenome]